MNGFEEIKTYLTLDKGITTYKHVMQFHYYVLMAWPLLTC